jgi:transcriptional regulator with XRE-family HTH domain
MSKLKYHTKQIDVPDSEAIGTDARARREAAGLSLRDTSARMKISAMFLCDLERAKRGWTPVLVAKFNRALFPKK